MKKLIVSRAKVESLHEELQRKSLQITGLQKRLKLALWERRLALTSRNLKVHA